MNTFENEIEEIDLAILSAQKAGIISDEEVEELQALVGIAADATFDQKATIRTRFRQEFAKRCEDGAEDEITYEAFFENFCHEDEPDQRDLALPLAVVAGLVMEFESFEDGEYPDDDPEITSREDFVESVHGETIWALLTAINFVANLATEQPPVAVVADSQATAATA